MTSKAFESYERFSTGLTAAIKAVDGDADSLGFSYGKGPDDEHTIRADSFSRYPLEQQPEFNNENIPRDHLYGKEVPSGFRCTKVKEDKLLDRSVGGPVLRCQR